MLKVAKLAMHSMNGSLDEERLQHLEELLETNPLAAEFYIEILWIHSGMNSMEGIFGLQGKKGGGLGQIFWEEMAEYEKTAPVLSVSSSRDRSYHESIRIVKPDNVFPKSKKTPLLVALVSAAALLFFIVFPRLFPPRPTTEVATISDSINAKWGKSSLFVHDRSRLRSTDTGHLLEGIVKIVYDNGVEVIVEGPAEFSVPTATDITLEYGCMFARIPPTGRGVSISTANSRVIVFGTELGINAPLDDDTEVHVFKGQIALITGAQTEEKTVVDVVAGQAKCISRETSGVSEVHLQSRFFVQDIRSKQGIIWRGENLSLADLTAGGTGSAATMGVHGIDPDTGTLVGYVKDEVRRSNRRYVPVNSPFIDGVFSPLGGLVQITSQGHQFACPEVKDIYTHYIGVIYGPYEPGQFHLSSSRLLFGGKPFDTSEAPVILLHSNIGITYDLKAIRESWELPVRRFQAIGALASIIEGYTAHVDVWIYVDGDLRFKKIGYSDQSLPFDISLPLDENDRFLTFIVTDCSELSPDKTRAHAGDYFFLINPELAVGSAP